MLVVTVGFNVTNGSAAAAYSIAASLMCMIYALGNCSGAHFNPAVTLAIWISGRNKISTKRAWQYVGAQLLGGGFAGLTYSGIMGRAFPLAPGGSYGYSEAFIAETVFTFLLCFVVLCVATTELPSRDFFGLAIGSCVTVGGFAVGGVSGGILNPAVAFGIEAGMWLRGSSLLTYSLGIYTVAQCFGSLLAAVGFWGTHPSEYFVDRKGVKQLPH